MSDENQLIQRIARVASPRVGPGEKSYGLELGIGDDAAILARETDKQWVVSCDAFIEGVHFLPVVHPADSVGYKALVRAASDLVAMGAQPRLFFLTLALPKGRTGAWLDGFLRGMRRAARYLDMRLAGGDTTTGAIVSISVTVLGQIGGAKTRRRRFQGSGRSRRGGQALTRSEARPGDRIYVSGRLGSAQLGLEFVRRGFVKQRRFAGLLQPHLYPRLRLKLGRWLANKRVASAMMDLSDGLSSDLPRLCRASGVGARLWADRIPATSVPPALLKFLPSRAVDPLRMALHGGDDYELLFTVPARNERRLRTAPEFPALTLIGKITRDRLIVLVDRDGKNQALRAAGWDPFR